MSWIIFFVTVLLRYFHTVYKICSIWAVFVVCQCRSFRKGKITLRQVFSCFDRGKRNEKKTLTNIWFLTGFKLLQFDLTWQALEIWCLHFHKHPLLVYYTTLWVKMGRLWGLDQLSLWWRGDHTDPDPSSVSREALSKSSAAKCRPLAALRCNYINQWQSVHTTNININMTNTQPYESNQWLIFGALIHFELVFF